MLKVARREYNAFVCCTTFYRFISVDDNKNTPRKFFPISNRRSMQDLYCFITAVFLHLQNHHIHIKIGVISKDDPNHTDFTAAPRLPSSYV